VDFDLSPEQQDLREGAIVLLDRLASAARVRAFVGPGTGDDGDSADRTLGYDRSLWEALADQGWLAVELPEENGGLGLGMVEVAVLCEELGRRAAPAPFVLTILCLGAVVDALGDPSLPADARPLLRGWRDGMAAGEVVGCVAWSADPAALSAVGTGADAGYILDGDPEPTVYAPVADLCVVVADDAVFVTPLGEGDRPSPEPAMDRTRPLGWLRLRDAPAHRIGGPEAAARLLDRAVTAAAAELLGASSRVLEMAVEYAKTRRQFGHPIGSFQAVKHRLADALVDVEGMRSSAYYAAWCLATRDPDGSLVSSMAKAWCSDASRRVMAAGLQVHGGIGFTWDHDLHLYLKRAQLDASGFGDARWHRDRVAGILQQRLAAGVGPF
jgi:alkylation response protein AidB-like acyl-CoA dehydrogenase